ncbi:hypothetical protein LUZ63_018286 [Rhynchospora breviuscula]|uniref:FAF domain-containing protein n=1 Tax=Rhynchospora breviuscula TaxID=2022672 RepID=A0A9Q0C426_9POAL|nr:hypothetical protein LUZ63_018286 [Rhynchospora breviuscula]
MSVLTYNSMETDKVGPIAAPNIPELKTYNIPNISAEEEKQEEDQLGQTDIWNLIQSQKPEPPRDIPAPYVHPLVRRSSSSLSRKSLEICTESLGSETGSDDFLSSYTDSETDTESEDGHRTKMEELEPLIVAKDVPAVKMGLKYARNQEFPYHCTPPAVSRKSPPRSFPPPLPSISSRNGTPCLRMLQHRCGDGRLVMEAVSMPTQNYLHASRHDGRLLLSFADQHAAEEPEEPESEIELIEWVESDVEEIETEESEEEEEVEVVDRGTTIEVKVSTQPNQLAGGSVAASKKVHRSSLIINKFVGSSPDDAMTAAADTVPAILPPSRRAVAMPTTAAAAVVAASALSASSEYKEPREEEEEEEDGQLLFVATTAGSRRRSKEELLHQMRRCSQLRRPLFIWEPRCIATS